MSSKRILGIGIALLIVWLIYQFGHLFTLERIKTQQEWLNGYIEQHFLLAAIVYFVFYTVITTFSIPGAAVVTLLGAALFGFWFSLLLVSFASTIGATFAFLSSRFLLRDWVQNRFGDRLIAINEGVKKEGAYYLFSLRLIPIFPFFLINLLMGLTPMSTTRFYFVSQLGMLPGTLVYLNAGTQIAQIERLSDVASPAVLVSFAILGLFPLVIKWTLSKWHPRFNG